MNLLEILRQRIQASFPDITDEELELRLEIAYELMKNI